MCDCPLCPLLLHNVQVKGGVFIYKGEGVCAVGTPDDEITDPNARIAFNDLAACIFVKMFRTLVKLPKGYCLEFDSSVCILTFERCTANTFNVSFSAKKDKHEGEGYDAFNNALGGFLPSA